MSAYRHEENIVRQRTVVKSGGTIEIHDPALPEGANADVTVVVERNDASLPLLSSLIGAAKGCFSSAEEIDQYLDQLRNEWDD
ncbi:MAG: hypothetical protein AAB353_03450 [Candidatus Hydrogenedentota bacterium]